MADWDASEAARFEATLKAAGPKAEKLADLIVRKTGLDTVSGAQNLVPVDTGNLKNSIGVDFGDLEFEAGPTANYGAHIEWGVDPHVITQTNKKALYWEGAEHPVRRVNHPGNAPQPYMRPAFEKATKPVPELLAQAGEKALE